MKHLYEFPIALTVQGPILTKSTSPSSFGVDAAVARDLRSGKPMLPGTLIEGKVRESLEQMGEATRLNCFFGSRRDEGTGNEPYRGKLLIGDLIVEKFQTVSKNASNGDEPSEEPVTTRRIATISRIAIDSTLGSAMGEMLRVIETPYLAGDKVTFKGTATMFCEDNDSEKEAREIATLLRLGLLWLVQVGANRTTGFGKVLDAEVSFQRVDATPEPIITSPVALDLAIAPLGPLCIARHKIGNNLYESDDVIPGNMLAGAIMQTAEEVGIVIPDFDKIYFCHAFPANGTTRPGHIPHSTVKAGRIPYDIARFREPVLLSDGSKFVAPAFALDWKDHADVLSKLGWADPQRELRVRTTIDSTNRTADRGENEEGGQLFAWEMVHPFSSNGKSVVWRSRIVLSKVSNAKATATALAQVLAHFSFVSKTKVRCQVSVTTIGKHEEPPDLHVGKEIILVLRTPALLADPRFQNPPEVKRTSGALSPTEMLTLYRAVWNELSGESLELSHHFARQFLAGGNYLAHRFQKRKNPKGSYEPWFLTEGGSVFSLKVTNAEIAMEKLKDWFATGLPLPDWARQRFGDDWKHNPYIPENGFGEVAIHRPEFAVPKASPVNLTDPILPKTAQ